MSYEMFLGDIAEVVMGQSPAGETCNQEYVGMPLLNGPTEFGVRSPTATQFTTDPRKKCKPGDLLFCVRGSTTGRMNWAQKEYAIGRGLAAIRGKNGYSNIYVRAAIENSLTSLLAQATGSTFPNVSRDLLTALKIPRVTLEISNKVSCILESIESQIFNLIDTNETLESICQAIFKSWFVKFDPVYANQQGIESPGIDALTASMFPNNFENSDLGLIPKGWVAGKIGDLILQDKETINPGAYPETIFDHYSLPAFDVDKMPAQNLGEDIKSNKTILRNESVLISKLNPKTPRVWLPAKVAKNSICSTEFIPFSPNASIGSTRSFIFCLLNDPSLLLALSQHVTGTSSSHQRIRPSTITEMRYIFPNAKLINAFTEIANPLLDKVSLNRLLIRDLQQIRGVLLSRLISGKLDLREIEEVA